MDTDEKIARACRPRPIPEVAREKLGLRPEDLELHGPYMAKLSLPLLRRLESRPRGKLILVTAMSPTPFGEGKTTTAIGLVDALQRLGQRAILSLREPSVGPVFGVKGGATGGGKAQVIPREEINLNFTGDFGAIALAHNLLAALLDNHLYHGNQLEIVPWEIGWRRVVDVNDRALRQIVVGLETGSVVRRDAFDIVAASEVMAILCLARSLAELKERLGNIVVAWARGDRLVRARDLGAAGAMTALLRDAFKPNLVQTLEGNPALVHGGPFGNIAHGCSSLVATEAGLRLADYVVTEAGFGSDLGAEKFIHIKCRRGGLQPSAAVIVATLRSIKYHGGCPVGSVHQPNAKALAAGVENLHRHVQNVWDGFGLPCVVCVNRFSQDSEGELAWLQNEVKAWGVPLVTSTHWANGSAGAVDLAEAVMGLVKDRTPPQLRFVYESDWPLLRKLEAIAVRIYRASGVEVAPKARKEIERLERRGFGSLDICVAKTQYSFTADPRRVGAPEGFVLPLREVRLAAGAGFVVMICGETLTMPGLQRDPAAAQVDVDEEGNIYGIR